MDVTWQVILSYDADNTYYQPINENLDFGKIQDEVKDFRLALIVLLLDAKAERLVSYTKSAILFEITLDQRENPTGLFDKLFKENFKGKADFHYMIQCTVKQNNYQTFVTNNDLSLHAVNFQLDVDKGKELLPLIKKPE
jgi:hypothetical protein